MVPKLKWLVLTVGRKSLCFSCCWWIFPRFFTLQGGRGSRWWWPKVHNFFLTKKNKTNLQLFFWPFCPHKKVFLRSFTKIQLSKHNYMTEHSIVYYCSHIFHRILRRSLTIIFSQREGSSHVASIKAPSFQQPILSNDFSILAQEGQESEFECINIKSWRCEKKSLRKMWGKI